MRNKLLHKMRTLTIALIVSGGVNITLIGVTAYWILKERPPTPYCELKPASSRDRQAPLALDTTNKERVHRLKQLALPDLVKALDDASLIENGYTERDLALGCMVAFHYFDLHRAVTGLSPPQQKRTLTCVDEEGSSFSLTVFPNLSDEHFAAIKHFYQTEQWPLTDEGLFHSLKKTKDNPDSTLAYAFFLTPEFLAVETLLLRAEPSTTKQEILAIILDGSWKMLATFTERQRQCQDLSDARRQKLLIDYIELESLSAAKLILKTDGAFAAKKLDDSHVMQILRLMTERSAAAARFALAMLMSPRSDKVWQEAAARLYEYVGEPKPQKYHRNVVLARFVPLAIAPKDPIQEQKASQPLALKTATTSTAVSTPIKKESPPLTTTPKKITTSTTPSKPKLILRSYRVKEGDTLWKISRQFNIEIDTLKKINQLNDTPLKPGLILSIPTS